MVWNDTEKITYIEQISDKFVLNGLDLLNDESRNKLISLLDTLSLEQLVNFFENDPFYYYLCTDYDN